MAASVEHGVHALRLTLLLAMAEELGCTRDESGRRLMPLALDGLGDLPGDAVGQVSG